MRLAALQEFTLSDFPGKIAAIVFTQGCNFRCSYCHNPSLLDDRGEAAMPVERVYNFLEQRRDRLEAVVLTGGEPTLQEELLPFLVSIKKQGYAIKLDTNGSRPEILEKIIRARVVDYIAMDLKAPLEKYQQVIQRPVDTGCVHRSIGLLMRSGIDYEFRTTVAQNHLTPDDIFACGRLIQGAARWYLQQVQYGSLPEELKHKPSGYSERELNQIKNRVSPLVSFCEVR